jgi:hypothetical protein
LPLHLSFNFAIAQASFLAFLETLDSWRPLFSEVDDDTTHVSMFNVPGFMLNGETAGSRIRLAGGARASTAVASPMPALRAVDGAQ